MIDYITLGLMYLGFGYLVSKEVNEAVGKDYFARAAAGAFWPVLAFLLIFVPYPFRR